jgi:hypothetical protein
MLLDREEGITVHYQCEDRDFGEVLETLHAGVLENIWAGRDTRFGDVLLEALSYSSVVDGP